MKKLLLIAFGILLLVVTAGCGPRHFQRYADNKDKVEACIAQGGNPEYSTSHSGRYVVNYYGLAV